MEITGSIKQIDEVRTFDSGFRKREFVITTEEQYPQDVLFECVQDRVSIVDKYNTGDKITVQFNIRGREYNGRHFVNLQAWRIDAARTADIHSANDALPDIPDDSASADEDIPF